MNRDFGVERRVFAGVADTKDEFAGIDDPLLGWLIPVAEGARVERERDVAGFAGSETDFGESLQLALGAVNLRGWIGDVELRDLGSCDCAGVGNVEAD